MNECVKYIIAGAAGITRSRIASAARIQTGNRVARGITLRNQTRQQEILIREIGIESMKQEDIKGLCEKHGVTFVNHSYGLATTKTVTLDALSKIISEACNGHEALLAALREIDVTLKGDLPITLEVKQIARAAIQLAERQP